MIALLKINDYTANNTIVVPINLVQIDQTGTFVVLAEKSGNGAVVKKMPVVAGQTYKGLTEVKSGLKSGDKVVSAGYLGLENGQAINY